MLHTTVKGKGKVIPLQTGVAQREVRGRALLFHDHGTRRVWVVNSTPRPHFTPGEDPVPILQEAGWAPRSVWTGGKPRPHRDSIPDRPASSSVAIPTELPGPHILQYLTETKNGMTWDATVTGFITLCFNATPKEKGLQQPVQRGLQL